MSIIIRRLHYKNAVLSSPELFSCAVDCFLEVAEHVFFQYFGASMSQFCCVLSDACYDYESMLSLQLTTEDLFCMLQINREIVWSVLRNRCISFYSMNANAQFSEIFSLETFRGMTEAEKSIFIMKFNLFSFCNFCQIPLASTLEVFVHCTTLESWPGAIKYCNVDQYCLTCTCGRIFHCADFTVSILAYRLVDRFSVILLKKVIIYNYKNGFL